MTQDTAAESVEVHETVVFPPNGSPDLRRLATARARYECIQVKHREGKIRLIVDPRPRAFRETLLRPRLQSPRDLEEPGTCIS